MSGFQTKVEVAIKDGTPLPAPPPWQFPPFNSRWTEWDYWTFERSERIYIVFGFGFGPPLYDHLPGCGAD